MTMIKKLLVVAAVALAACSGEKQKPPVEKIPVTVALAEVKDVPVQLRAIGTVQEPDAFGERAMKASKITTAASPERATAAESARAVPSKSHPST